MANFKNKLKDVDVVQGSLAFPMQTQDERNAAKGWVMPKYAQLLLHEKVNGSWVIAWEVKWEAESEAGTKQQWVSVMAVHWVL